MTDPEQSDDVDQAALDLAWQMFLEREPDTFRDGTREDKEHAAYSLQVGNLKLSCWQEPPMHLDDGSTSGSDDLDAWKLAKRMKKAGVSIYHPDPLRALSEAERRDAEP